MGNEYKAMTLRLLPEQAEQLKSICEQTGRSRSDAIREWIRQGLAADVKALQEQQHRMGNFVARSRAS